MASRTHKAAAKSFPRFQITFPELPGAVFSSEEAVHEHLPFVLQEQKMKADFIAFGCEATLWHEAFILGWSDRQISDFVKNPTLRDDTYYGAAGDFQMAA